MPSKNVIMVGLTLLVILLVIWRHKTCPGCQENFRKAKEKVTG
jgi:hypothetical protein